MPVKFIIKFGDLKGKSVDEVCMNCWETCLGEIDENENPINHLNRLINSHRLHDHNFVNRLIQTRIRSSSTNKTFLIAGNKKNSRSAVARPVKTNQAQKFNLATKIYYKLDGAANTVDRHSMMLCVIVKHVSTFNASALCRCYRKNRGVQ